MGCRRWVLVMVLGVGGCVAPVGEVGLGRDHPANPEAAEAPMPVRSGTLGVGEGANGGDGVSEAWAGKGGATTRAATATSAAFVCPMHAQVVSDRAGNCPICHMKLVPNKAHEHGVQGGGR
jgi:hypothetical protein